MKGNVGPVLEKLCKDEGDDGLDEVVALNVINRIWERFDAIKSSRA